jgi:hypothetical protein
MSKEQQQIIDEAYENYLQHYDDEYNEEQKKIQENPLHWMEMRYTNIRPYPKEMFINKCKTDPEFSEKWGLKIEESELSLEERFKIQMSNVLYSGRVNFGEDYLKEVCDRHNIPAKLITITYNDKTIESYE